MASELVRFGLAVEADLLEQIDALAAARECTRSELLRDLARSAIARSSTQGAVPAVAAVTLVYNHHVRQLSERLTEIQHELGEQVRSTMHVHLDHDNCLEVIVMRGRSDELAGAASKMLATRGVTHGGVEMVSERALRESRTHRHKHGHDHAHDHDHAHPPARAKRKKTTSPR